jgi:putative transposase
MQRHGLTQQQTAMTFQITAETVARWLREQERSESRLVQPKPPVNRRSDLKREMVQRPKKEQGAWGTKKICHVLVRLGLKLSRRSVQRILRERPRHRPKPRSSARLAGRPLRARYPLHAVMMDLTTIRIPLVREVWVAVLLDVFSRKVLVVRAWNRTPAAADTRSLVSEVVGTHGPPRYLITDRGTQFTAGLFKRSLRRHGIRHRYGAVGRWQHVAIIDRFFGSLKREYASRWLLLLPLKYINAGLNRYAAWFSRHRPHQGLQGRTPEEVFYGRRPRSTGETCITGLRLTHYRRDRNLPIYQRLKAA